MSKLWREYTVMVPKQFGGTTYNIPMCGLCGNSGTLDTTEQVKVFGSVPAGIKAPCICPNGRQNKRRLAARARREAKKSEENR